MFLFLRVSGQTIEHHNGHAHNDYLQERPLYDALSFGFLSIEADISPYKGNLIVSHGPFGLRKKQTLDELYLLPLDSIINANNGTVYPSDSSVLILMIDFKMRKKKSLSILFRKLEEREDLLYKRIDGVDEWGPIQIVLTGSPPPNVLSREAKNYIFLDGRPGRLYPENISDKVIMFSSSYESAKRSGDVFTLIKGFIKSSNKHDRKVRFWATPDKFETWDLLDALGVHWIAVDDLQKFYEYRLPYSVE